MTGQELIGALLKTDLRAEVKFCLRTADKQEFSNEFFPIRSIESDTAETDAGTEYPVVYLESDVTLFAHTEIRVAK